MENDQKPKETAEEAAAAWLQEISLGNLPPVIVGWAEPQDGVTIANDKAPRSLKGTENSLNSMIMVLNGTIS